VAIIGGGNSALDAGLQMKKIAKHIYIINNSSSLSADAIMRQKIQDAKNVTLWNNTWVSAVLGDKFVNGLEIIRQDKKELLAVEGVFVEIGLIPNSGFVPDVEKNQFAEIKVNSRNETNIPGIFAAGDVTDVTQKQIIIAAGEGAKACLSVFEYLSQQKI
jgi:alkyl hydroperoxide reductase subunit AhpF